MVVTGDEGCLERDAGRPGGHRRRGRHGLLVGAVADRDRGALADRLGQRSDIEASQRRADLDLGAYRRPVADVLDPHRFRVRVRDGERHALLQRHVACDGEGGQ